MEIAHGFKEFRNFPEGAIGTYLFQVRLRQPKLIRLILLIGSIQDKRVGLPSFLILDNR